MFDARIRVGLFVTPLRTVVVRDTLSSMSLSSNVFEREALGTEVLLRAVDPGPRGGDLCERFMQWLLAQAEFETLDGVLRPRRASA
jgi:hypothetical protein